MSRMWQVALREIRQMGKSKTYLITSAAVLIGVVALIVLPNLFPDEAPEYKVGAVGEGNQAIIDAAILIATAGDDPEDDPSVVFTVEEFADRESAIEALEEGEISAILVDGTELILQDEGMTQSGLHMYLQQGAVAVELERLVAEHGAAAAEVIGLLTSAPLEPTFLDETEGPSTEQGFIAFIGLMLLYIAILLYGNWILTGVTEEKSSRVVEVLLSTLKPWQLLGGKVIGIGTLGLAQFSATILVAVIGINLYGAIDIPEVAMATVVNLIIWFILGFLVFAALFATAGSLVSRVEDAQNMAFPISMIAVIGFFVSIQALENPGGTVAAVGTFIPITAPFVIPVRVALENITVWEYAAGVAITLVSIVGLIAIAGRIYRGGALRTTGRMKVREAWRSAQQ